MDKGSGPTFIGLGIALIIAGAIARYAVTVHTDGFDIHTAGVIALVAGIISLVLGLAMTLWPSRRRSVTTDRSIATPHGQERIQESEDIDSF